MAEDFSVRIENLTKIYKIYKHPWYRVLYAFNRHIPYEKFYALNGISVTIGKGETVGVIGKNGHGKSTLLKLITGVSQKTSGSIETNGRIVAMLELTSGFDKELTGRENVYIKGRTIGLSKEDIDSRMNDILDFADIGEYVDQPVRTYSSGMKSRLGFAVSANLDPDILIVDEVLAVGDTSFKLKCLNKMEEFRKQGKTILFVSHDLATVKAFCSSCMWIKNGRLEAFGETGGVVQRYQDYLKAERAIENERRRRENIDLILTKDDMLTPSKASLYDADGNRQTVFEPGDDIVIKANYEVKAAAEKLSCAITVFDSENREIFGNDRQSEKFSLNSEAGKHSMKLCIKHPQLLPGHYSIECEIWNTQSGFVRGVLKRTEFEITSDYFMGTGIAALDCTCESK